MCVSVYISQLRCTVSSVQCHHLSCTLSSACFPGDAESWFMLSWISTVGNVEHWQPSVKNKCLIRMKTVIWDEKHPLLTAYQKRAEIWHGHFVSHLPVTCRDIRSVTQRPAAASVDLNSNTSVFATLTTCTWAKARFYQPTCYPGTIYV